MLVINVYLLKYLCEFLDGKPLCGHGGVISVVGIVYCVQPVISGWHLRARRNYPYPLSGFIKPCARRLYVFRAELLAVAGKRVAVGYKVNLQQFCISLFPGHALGNVTAVCGRGALRNAVRLKGTFTVPPGVFAAANTAAFSAEISCSPVSEVNLMSELSYLTIGFGVI